MMTNRLFHALFIASTLMLAACGGDEPDTSATQPPAASDTEGEAADFSELTGYWLNEDESCMIEFSPTDENSCKVTTFIPTIAGTNGVKYKTWNTTLHNPDSAFDIIVFADAYSCPVIRVGILRLRNNSMMLSQRDDSSASLSSSTFRKVNDSTANAVLTKGWNPNYLRASGSLNGFDYVDLGLSANWACQNLADNSKTNALDFGDYYIHDEQDHATMVQGAGWATPSNRHLTELINKCSWEWVNIDGINGALVTGPNGRSIFLPAAGGKIDGTNKDLNRALRYASSSTDGNSRRVLSWYPDENKPYINSFALDIGYSIRPVTD